MASSSLGRARRALGSIGERLLEAFTDSSAQEAEHKHRLRGVLLRDRELLAGDHDRARHGDGSVLEPVSVSAAPSAPAPHVPQPHAEPSAHGALAVAPAQSASAVSHVAPAPLAPLPPAARSAAPAAPRASAADANATTASAASSISSPATARAATRVSAPVLRSADDSEDTFDEPIRTRSMARLLAGQGHHRRALSIYEALLAEPGADSSLQAEADALRSRLAT